MNDTVNQQHRSIHDFIFPEASFMVDEPLYFRFSQTNSQYCIDTQTLHMKEGGWASFDTFFNSFSVGFWKKNCRIEDLFFTISGSGTFIVKFGLHRLDNSHQWLFDKKLSIDDNKERIIDLPFWRDLDEGMLYVRIYAIETSEIVKCSFKTRTEPVRNVKLGVCITHFNREKYLIPAVGRLETQLFNNPALTDQIYLIVVDNSNTLTIKDTDNIKIIPNRNYGGSGGFSRGLMHLQHQGSFTHCLFMDDDASCEIESIRRALQILAYSRDENIALSGALLRANETFRLFEKGARFDGLCRPNKQWLDMRSVHDLLIAEQYVDTDYGGWWFFAFSINCVQHYPFPFFIRGDDILFSLMNKFKIVTLNGIACWGEDFALKHSPLLNYLDARNHIIIQMLILNRSAFDIIKQIYLTLFVPQLFSYNYETASGVTRAFKDVMKGPQFWRENFDLNLIRSEINTNVVIEKMRKITELEKREAQQLAHKPDRWIDRIIRDVTGNGHFLPSFMTKNKVVYQAKSFSGNFGHIFGFNHVLYEDKTSGTGYVTSRNPKKYLSELISYAKTSIEFSKCFTKLMKEYRKELPELTSLKFWEEVYDDKRLPVLKADSPPDNLHKKTHINRD